jgi:hypothetical protein
MAKIQVIAVTERMISYWKEPQKIDVSKNLSLIVDVYHKKGVESILGIVTTAEESKKLIDNAKKVNREIYGDRCKFNDDYNDKDAVYITYGTMTFEVDNVVRDITCFKEAEKINICGYRASDLAIIAERYKLAKIDNKLLSDNNKAYIDGYNKAHKEIQNSFDKIIGRIGGANEKN